MAEEQTISKVGSTFVAVTRLWKLGRRDQMMGRSIVELLLDCCWMPLSCHQRYQCFVVEQGLAAVKLGEVAIRVPQRGYCSVARVGQVVLMSS